MRLLLPKETVQVCLSISGMLSAFIAIRRFRCAFLTIAAQRNLSC